MPPRSGPRLMRSDEFEELTALLDRCFAFERGGMAARLPFVYDPDRPERHAVVEVGGDIVSHAACVPETLAVGDRTTVDCRGIGGVATAKPHRGNGHMSALLEFWLDRIDADGVPLVELGGDRQRYARFGWEPAGRELVYTITPRSAPETSESGEIARFDGSDAEREAIRRIHRADSLRVERDGATARSIYGQRGLETLCYRDESDAVRAYVCLSRESRDRELREFGGDAPALEALLAALFTRTDVNALTAYAHPTNPRTELLEKYSARWRLRPPRSMNVRDLPAVVTAYAGPLERRWERRSIARETDLTLGIEGDETAVRLASDRDRLTVETVSDEPSLSIDRRDAPRLLFGGNGRRERLADEYPILEALFPLEYYVWHAERV